MSKKHPATKDKYFIDSEELKKEVKKCQETKTCTERMGKMLIQITDCVSNMPEFKRYSAELKDELKSFSIFRFLKNGLWTVDTEKTANNVFFYFYIGSKLNFMNKLKSLGRKAEKQNIVKKHYIEKILQNAPDIPYETKLYYEQLINQYDGKSTDDESTYDESTYDESTENK